MDPFDRDESYRRIDMLLKLALRANHPTRDSTGGSAAAPPPTPASAAIRQDSRLFDSPSSSENASRQSSTTSALSLPRISYEQLTQADEKLRREKADNIWKHMYDFFAHFNDRAYQNEELIEKRLAEARSIIPVRVADIMSINFVAITSHMNQEIACMKTPADYSNLYERKIYIDQLCYLFWFVEHVCNQVSYIETLYPSTKQMREHQKSYASPKFEAATKTLLLWYKIVHDLMHTCDVVGKYLGFEKRPENKQYWTWFHERLVFSKAEFKNVQTWLDKQSLVMPNRLMLKCYQCFSFFFCCFYYWQCII